MELKENTVLISLKEYNDYIISQYENGKLKNKLLDELKNLKETIKQEKEELESILNKRTLIIDAVVVDADYKLKEYSRYENLNLDNYKSIFYRGDGKYKKLIKLGFTEQDLTDYINDYFDKKEKEDKEEE